MKTRVSEPRSRAMKASRPATAERTVEISTDLAHDVLDVLDFLLRPEKEGLHTNSRGQLVQLEGSVISHAVPRALEAKLKNALKRRSTTDAR